ncbi:MAG: 1-deoxy-D-xylulose-5-phosphate reductoisomerase [Betaproteobacteria bacterium]|nr:1-deoxy-D-xylulose-5-phosphate reductoisomerase [Betaproteobacteria bacterium]MBU6512698.1 1-deoxy-D-xylulose-5-phosphate reductoisomerase [Betaproteobacteria bacterium]MDE1955527.1 1-deoxy-D-xylulose-5-phosphate reductoisomerase [Betaproteobacteria bacterium]MDE2478065.1 1-deoxy-D-xylulose-5-phosphate reductoisomerase [Betaproteobacteria bacterium]
MKRITILGSTGSIGRSTLEVLSLHAGDFEVFALAARSSRQALLEQCLRFAPRYAVLEDAVAAQWLQRELAQQGSRTQVLAGAEAMPRVAADPEVDMVMAAIVGAAGLDSALAAARAGKRVLLANKESLVVAGELFMRAMREGGGELLPIDSEHSAILQSLPEQRERWAEDVREITLTASGGPFRRTEAAALEAMTPEQACAHPNWSMGRKISVDSATMMNKALEVIEAHYLFGMPASRIRVLIHPQSIVHSMVTYHDGSVVAQLGVPDMRTPIAYGLSWPRRMASGSSWLDLARIGRLDFEEPDAARFPGLGLAFAALDMAGGACAVLNAANEVAVQAFLDGKLRFTGIHRVNAATLEALGGSEARELPDLLDLDARARSHAAARVRALAG